MRPSLRPLLHVICGVLLCAGWSSTQADDGRVSLRGPSLSGVVKVKSWKALRDARVVKQALDYSCGAAALATVLNEHYGQAVTERDVLRVMAIGDGKASFEDLQHALRTFGFRAVGVAASYEQLAKLTMPVIVYLEHRKTAHFSVLRGVDHKTVWLADPSLGNRTYSRSQFLAMWNTRTDATEPAELQGKLLLVFPAGGKAPRPSDFFTNTPRRQTALAVERLEFSPILGLAKRPWGL